MPCTPIGARKTVSLRRIEHLGPKQIALSLLSRADFGSPTLETTENRESFLVPILICDTGAKHFHVLDRGNSWFDEQDVWWFETLFRRKTVRFCKPI